jgi:putative phosphoesterase
MKTAFISDIHGNYEALKAVLASIDAMGITHIVCAGDVTGYYTEVNACCDTLRVRAIPTVMGNHDWYLGGGGFCVRSRSVNDCLEYQRRVITPDNLAWLRGLPLQVQANGVRVVHGGWSDPLDEYLKPSANYFSVLEGRFFLTGHSHLPCVEHYGEKIYCNPGSVGQPRDGDPRSAFAVFDGSDFTIHRVDYDFNKVFVLMDAAGFNDYYYGALATGARNLRRLADPQEQKS